jgi:hypothetical protein
MIQQIPNDFTQIYQIYNLPRAPSPEEILDASYLRPLKNGRSTDRERRHLNQCHLRCPWDD